MLVRHRHVRLWPRRPTGARCRVEAFVDSPLAQLPQESIASRYSRDVLDRQSQRRPLNLLA